MSVLNPYERFLTGRPVPEILSSTAAQMGLLIAAIGPVRATIPAAPTWPTASWFSRSGCGRRWLRMRRSSSPSIRKSGP